MENRLKFFLTRVQDGRETSEMPEELLGKRLDILPGNGISQEKLKDLIVVHPGGSIFSKPLPQPLAVVQVIRLGFHFSFSIPQSLFTSYSSR
jgi:hypothetical protein